MAVPNFQEFFLPLLRICADGKEHTFQQTFGPLAEVLRISPQDASEMLASGRQTRMQNRIYWAGIFLKQAALLQGTRRGYFSITERGRAVLAENPARLDTKFLERYPEYRRFIERSTASKPADESGGTAQTPEEMIEESVLRMRKALTEELLAKLKSCSPRFFEQLVVTLLLKMGYGGSWNDAAQVTGGAGDGGIDGILKQDRLGLDIVYVQAKRWEGVVGRPEIQKFVGALHGKRARKGVFITTSSFTKEAREYADQIENKVVLIDGNELAEYMIDLGLGVTTKETYEVKKLDNDAFEDI